VTVARDDRERLIERHMGLVRSVARRYARAGEPVEDLVQVGAIGLIKAVDRYEPGRGPELRALAVRAIEGEIRHHLRDRSSLVRTPRPVHELGARARAAQARLTAGDGRTPTAAALARELGASERDVAEALRAGGPTAPLRAEHEPAAEDALAEDRALIEAGLELLSPRERRILRLRFYEDRSQADIAREVGLSQAHVSRLVRRALQRLRAAVVEGDGEAYPRDEMAVPEIEERAQPGTHSGRLLVRMPQSLHTELARVAEREGVSLNTLITGALASAVGWRDGAVDGIGDGDGDPRRPRGRWTGAVLAANLVVVAIVALAAVVLLVMAARHGW
jgi:RNA polymerase sigma-B factor